MSLKYKVITCSQDSRYPQDLVLTLRFVGEAPDANAVICIIEDAPDLLEALEAALTILTDSVGDFDYDKAMAAISKAKGEQS